MYSINPKAITKVVRITAKRDDIYKKRYYKRDNKKQLLKSRQKSAKKGNKEQMREIGKNSKMIDTNQLLR